MPPIVNQIAEELLPLIFRRKRPSLRQPIGNDLPEQGGFSGQMPRPNVLGVQQQPAPPITVPPGMNASAVAMADEERPRRTTPPNITAPAPPLATAPLAPEPMVSRSGQVMDEYSTRPARRVETDVRGRPARNITLEGDDQTLDYANRVAKYEPQEGGGGWWPKIRAALAGFAAGGPVGAGAAFGTRMLREKFEPTLADQEWKREQMGEVGPEVEQIRKSRKDTLQEESTRANIDLAKARTDALKNPKQSARIVERKDGVYMLNPQTNKFEKVAEIPPEAGTPGSTRYIPRADGVYGVNAEHPNGFKLKGIPGNAGKDEEDVSFGNAQIQRAISEAQAEQAKIDSAMVGIPPTIEATDILTGTKKMAPNPEYTYNMTRRRQLDDQIRRWRTQLKAPKTKAGATSTIDDPLGILEDEEP